MSFDFGSLFRFIGIWLASIRWTPRRTLIVLAFFSLFPFVQLFVWTGFLLDRLLYSRYRQTQVRDPVFVIGNFRSGTTYMHRLLAADAARFSTMKMWEVLFAPSVTQRRIARALKVLDSWMGRPGSRLLSRLDSLWHKQVMMHEVSLTQPEEDEYVLLHRWSALTIGLSSGLLDEAAPYVYFDRDLPAAERRRIMQFYFECVQRHVYFHECVLQATGVWSQPGRTYLAKNPALTPKIDSLLERFPDAKLIYMVRSPLEVIPSFLSMLKFSWEVMGATVDGPELRDFVLEMARHWYRYPLERLANASPASYMIVNYEDLVSRPDEVIRSVYQHFDFAIDETYGEVLREAARGADNYTSRHRYSLQELGLTPEELVIAFADVFERFGFSTEPGR